MRSSRRHCNRRCGYTLIEVASVVAATSALMTVGVLTLRLAHNAEASTRDRAGAVRALSSAAETFRTDVHAAGEFKAADDAGTWRFSMPDGRIAEYSVSDGRLVRREVSGEKTVSTQEFDLPPEAVVAMTEEPLKDKTLVHLRIEGSGDRTATITALLGHDLRFAAKEDEE